MSSATTAGLVDSILGDAASIGEDTRREARRLLMDVLGVAVAGSTTAEGRVMLGSLVPRSAAGPCGVATSHARLAPEAAALVNGTLAYSIGLTDTHSMSITHPAPSVVPTALAVGEAVGADLNAVLDAITVGVEVITRVGAAVNPSHRQRGFHPTATCNHFGTAFAASYLLGSSREQTLSALGIAGSFAGGLYEFRHRGSMLMALHGGWPAHGGIQAAYLAHDGFTGPDTVLEGSEGFIRAFSDDPHAEMLARPAGSTWQIHELSMRPYCACRYAHAAIDALGEIMRRRVLAPAPINNMQVWLHRTGVEQESEPTTPVSARLSSAFNVAVAAIYGPRLSEPSDADLHDAAVLDLMSRIELLEDPELTAMFPRRWGARVRVEWADGSSDVQQVEVPKGDPENPMTDQELETKFRGLVEPVIGEAAALELRATLTNPSSAIADVWRLACPSASGVSA